MMKRLRQLKLWSTGILIYLWSFSVGAQKVTTVNPRTGSLNGATRLTINGEGFAQENQFTLNSNSKNFGNSVQLVSDTRSIPCDVERDSSHARQITCYTRAMPFDYYLVRVSVDGVPIPESNICNGDYKSYWCSFYPWYYTTPTITGVVPASGLPGTIIKMDGWIVTDVYGSNTDKSSNGLDIRVLRAYVGGMPCELLKPNSDLLYGLSLISEFSQWGTMTCKMTGTYVGHHNLSYILDGSYGRSLPDLSVYTVSSLNKLAMFQSYAEVNGVSPSEGSLQGGTILTINGRFFDQTDLPATVLVGGGVCEILSVSDNRIECKSPKHQESNITVFSGGRGLKLEMWNNSSPAQLDEVLHYNAHRAGYSLSWVDSLSYTWPSEADHFVARLSGFIVPTETDNYTFYIRGDDRYALYFSQTGLPQDKMKIAFFNSVAGSFFSSNSQKSERMHLEKGKPYYIEVLVQEYEQVASVEVGLFKEISHFTEKQTREARNEIQVITAAYDIFEERQEVSFENWAAEDAVREVQRLTINSSCFQLDSCGYTFYNLIYGSLRTVPIAVSATEEELQSALNALWSIKPDTVQVTKAMIGQVVGYDVLFISRRGDFESFSYESADVDVNITVTEIIKGRPSLETFTLQWGGLLSRPIFFNASESEVQSALEALVRAECLSEIQAKESSEVFYYRDYEDGLPTVSGRGTRVWDSEAFCGQSSLMNPEALFLSTDQKATGVSYGPVPLQMYSMLCFAYRGWLRDEIRVRFSYKNSNGHTATEWSAVTVLFQKGNEWRYICVNLLSPLKTAYTGSSYSLLDLYLYREMPNQDFFIDAVHLGSRPTTSNVDGVIQMRRPPALGRLGIFLKQVSVHRLPQADTPRVCYVVTATPYNCGHSLPLLGLGFFQASNSSEDMVVFGKGGGRATVTRTQRASPPMSGSFDIEIYGKRVEGLPVNLTAEELQYSLQGVPEMGQLQVTRTGRCTGYQWTVKWLSNPGNQPLLQINSSSVVGINPRIQVTTQTQGGLFKSMILGDFLRVPESRTQVQVLINGIPSKCTGNCGFGWRADRTPTITGISPKQGSYAQGTNLTITGYGFANEGGMVLVGDVECPVLQFNSTSLTCQVGEAKAGSFPVSVSFASLGHAGYEGGAPLNFTNQMGAFSISPSSGSEAGGTLLNVSGYGFGDHTSVLIGAERCAMVSSRLDQLSCRTPPGVPSTVAVSLETPDMSVPVDANFTYDNMQTPLITSMSPMTADVMGQTNLTILGARFQDGAGLSLVLVGGSHCKILQWSSGSITCLLPRLPPGVYNVHVQVENIGFARTSPDTNSTIEYILEVTSVFPEEGSLYGGTKLTIMGSGFSPDLTNNLVSVGDGWCEVTAASEHQLECVTQTSKRTYTVTNQGTHPDYGEGYAWSPSSLTVRVGDVVAWRWASPSFVPGLGYRVFSISSPSSTTYDGVGFTSGDAKTESGFYSYCFTTPGIYYYSSGYVDDRYQKFMQGVVVVEQVEDRNGRLNITVGGIEAIYTPVPQSSDLVTPECTSETSPNCSGNLSLDQPADGFTFRFLGFLSPEVLHITPNQGTTHTVILIEGVGFSNTSSANEVTVGGHACILINSTATEIYCHLSQDSGLEIAIAHPVSVRVNNLGTAITSVPSDFGRRFVVLPVIDSVIPSTGSTTGHTRLTVRGSGFSSQILSVSVVDQPCTILSVNYTVVVCDTSPSPAHIGSVNLRLGRTRAYCQGNCTFEYSSLLVPQIIEVSPASIGRNSTTVVVTGLGFGGHLAEVAVFAGDISLKVVEVTDTNITLVVGPLPAGDYTLRVVIASIGLASGDANLRSPPDAWLSPASGSTKGGTPLVITGNGFWPGNTSVTVGGLACRLEWVTPSAVRCLTPAHTEANTIVQIQVFSVAYPPLRFTYSRVDTPVVSAVSPATGPTGTSINITGSGFGTDPNIILVTIDEVECNLTALTDTEFQCDVGEHAGGTFSVTVHHMVKGYATSQALFSYELRMTTVIPSEGGYGGGSIVSIHGSGFDQKVSRVQICGKDCEVQRQMSTPTYLYCKVPSINSTTVQQVCAVQVLNGNTSVNRSSSFVYKSSLTPVIAGVSPRRGGTAGGTRLTIWGSNFSLNSSEISVDIAGSACDVDFANNTHIICTTNAQPTSQQAKVQVNIGDRGIAKMDSADFLYIDVWSSMYTWGGLSPPETGTFVVITQGQTILLDTSTPVLKMLLIQGGTLVFDELDIELQAENILITEGGTLQVGTETAPFQHKAIITLHGHLRSQELPVYGAKTLAVREGVLDLHGIPIPVPWTWLAETALAGSSTLTLQQTVTWREGDEIVISSTGNRHSQKENEVRRIAFVSANGRTLNLTKPLMYTHLGVSVTMPNGVVFEGRAEVGLLTRNIVVRGSENLEWSDKIEACPAGFNTGEFATQTCFQGRFGEEIGSDQFGGCIMFHAPRPSQNLAIGRIEYVEVFHAGQAFRLGRYPIHWHLMGDLQYKSYIRGCAIHQSYNRAVTIHNTHNLLVERNVIYDIMGGAFFIEDGIETGNILQYNLAVFVKQSTTLLNDDVTPAAFWVTNPNNTIRHNVAAGGTHFGFWYRMHEHPDGPSYNPQICQKFVPLGEFFNNTVHSQGWFGLWIFQDYFPMKEGQCGSMVPLPAVFRSLTTWNCEKGAEWVNVGAVQFSGFLMVNNEKAGVEAKRILSQFVSGWGENGGAVLINSTIVGHIDELGLGTGYCSNRGVVLPLDDGMSVLSTTFVNFDRLSCTAIGVASIDGTCVDHCGGWSAQFHGIRFYNCPNKAGFRWPHEVVLVDKDGSLTGHIDHQVVPLSNLLDPAHCLQSTEWSVGFPGAVCDNTVGFHRLAFNNPSPSSLYAKDVVLTNSHGTSIVPYLKKLITHNFGWMALVPTSETYNWYFDKMDFITNMSYTATFYGYKQEDYIIINHNLTQSPDSFKIVDWRNSSDQPLDFSRNVNGDWYFNKTTKTVYYMVSGKSQRKRRDTVNRAQTDITISFQVYRCFFKDCIVPAPGPALEPALATLPPLPNRRPVLYSRWSNESFWRSSPENNFTVPREGANVIIPLGTWIVMDIDIPPLNKMTLFGVLEIPDTMNETRNISQYRSVVLNATHISIQGGRLIAGWRDSPFQGKLQIVLRGMHSTPEWLLPSGPNQGAKVLGVFGSLDLYGMPHNVYHTKLARSAPAGSSILSLKKAVDWQVGDEIVISTTSYDPWQTEVRKIAAVFNFGRTLTLNQSLSYAHSGVSFNVPGTTGHYTLAADVGLLSRNIKIIGEDHPDWYTESFGGRVLVGSFTNRGIMYRGTAQIRNVEFYHTGQFGYPDSSDPRYSVVFLNLGQVSENDSYIQGCSLHQGFSPAIGVFGTDGLSIDDNVIYFTVGEGIRVWGNDIRVQRNLVTMSVWPGAYQDREQDNSEWTAAIEVSEGGNVLLQDNIVAGYERVAYRIDGELCPDAMNPMESWYQNEAHGGLYGVYMNQDGLAECSLIQGFTIWRSFDYGIYVQVPMSVRIANVTLVDNGMGVMSIIYSPPSVSHQYSNKTVHIQDSLIVGTSSDLNCSQVLSPSDANIRLSQIHRSPRPPNGGRSGVCWPNFASGHNNAPQQAHAGLSSYNAISGLMTVTGTVFVGFGTVCPKQGSVMFMTNPSNGDLQHPIHVKGVMMVDSTENAKVFIQRSDVRLVNPSDCVDMDCDAKKKALLKDLDGSFLGGAGAVVPQSEFEWGGDSRRGLGDYRIPKVMLTSLNGSRIPVNQIAPNKGVIRDVSCTYMPDWQSYKCFGLNYEMLVIESLDADTETRRVSPVAVLGSSYVDLLNGPQDHGWCAGYTCQRRVSLFHSIVATNKSFDVYFTSATPQKLRLMLLNSDDSKVVRVAVFYSKPQRLDVYVNSSLVAPTNAIWNSDKTDYTLQEPSFQEQYVPQLNSTVHGSNYFDRNYKMLNVLVRGSTPVEIHTSPLLFISFQLPAMTEEQFFGENLARNLALFLKVPVNMIRVTKVVREGGRSRRRRDTGLTVEVEISKPPAQQVANSSSEAEVFNTLKNIANELGQAAVSGNLSESIGFNVSSIGIISPPPPSSDAAWLQEASQEVTREEPGVSYVSSVSALLVVVQPVAGEFGGLLTQQPSIMAINEQDDCVSVGVTSLTLTARLKVSNDSIVPGLGGNTTIPFVGCWANYTDLVINAVGDNMMLAFTLNAVQARSKSFIVRAGSNTVMNSTSTPGVVIPTAGSSTTSIGQSIPDSGVLITWCPLCLFALVYSLMLCKI